jgi:hypothetical protein
MWGGVSLAALIGFIGCFACRSGGGRISGFYAIRPALLLGAFLVFFNLSDLVHVLLST